MSRFDAIELEVLWQSLIATVNEQAKALQRAAFSPIVREAGDLANAVFDRRGRMVAQAVTGTPGHINSLARAASAILVAPASAESLSHLARGGAQDLIGAALLSIPRTSKGDLKTPVFLAPAMHEAMWRHPATQANVKTLVSYGYQFIGPERGPLGRAGDEGDELGAD